MCIYVYIEHNVFDDNQQLGVRGRGVGIKRNSNQTFLRLLKSARQMCLKAYGFSISQIYPKHVQ